MFYLSFLKNVLLKIVRVQFDVQSFKIKLIAITKCKKRHKLR